MLDKIIHFSIYNKFVIGLLTLALLLWGSYSLTQLPIDALPDITNNQVQIITTSPALATQEVEQFITYPIELAVKSIPKVIELRSISRFGLSVVTVVFEENVDIYWARTLVNERLKAAEEHIPNGLGKPEMGPISTGLGEIYQYTIFAKSGFEDKYNAMDFRTIQDWIIVPQILGTKGVAEVNTLGGQLKQYEVAVNPDKLRSMKVNMVELFDALERSNENTGGAYIDKKPNAYFIRGIGMVTSLADIEKIVVKNNNGIPILVRDVATVGYGTAIRYGATTKNGKGEVVSGMVMMLKDENSADVVRRVKEKIVQIRKTLPEGVAIEPFLDRTKLVDNAIGTVEKNLLEGALIVVFILVLLIGNFRAGLIVASVIPLSMLFAVSMMRFFGVSGNLMSLGAIDFGLIVDGAVIIVESIVHRLQVMQKGKLSRAEMDLSVYQASAKIRSSAAFGEIIILIVYLPILALVGIEGKMFGPMAQTVSFAILGAFILSLTYIPMMSALFLSKKTGHRANISDKIIAFFYRLYKPFLQLALNAKPIVLGVSFLLLLGALFVFMRLGGEFIPTLEEGDIATHIMIPAGSSLSQEIEATTKAEQLLLQHFPEVEQVVSKIGSAEVPTDPMPMEVADAMVILKDKSEWTSAKTKEELMQKMEAVLDNLPGITTEFSQPIQMRFNELMTGVRSDVAIKIFGEDIDLLAGFADEVVALVQPIAGVENARAEVVSGLPQITIKYNPDKMALHGLHVSEVNKVLRSGFAGEKAGTVYEGEKRFDLVLRLEKVDRQELSDIKALYIPLESGEQIPLETLADIKLEPGPTQISREDGKRRIVIGFNVRGRDVQTTVKEIQAILDAKLKLPPGYFVTYGGQFQNLLEANKRLSLAVPLALGLIFVLLFFTFGSIKQSLLIFTAIPLSAIGGVFALWLRGMPFSISAGVGFIALFGVAVLNGIVLIGYFNQLKKEGMTNVLDRIMEGTKVRLRPVIMTAAVASLGFLPMALSVGAGAEVQKPLATVVIGGLITATLLTLIVLPILYYYFEIGVKNIKKSAILPIIGILSLANVTALQAQSPTVLSLEQAIETAYRQNPSLAAKVLESSAQNRLTKSVTIMPKTNIDLSLGQISTIRFDEYLSLSQDIPNPAYQKAQRQVAEQKALLSLANQAVTKQDLRLQIQQNWYEMLYWQEIKNALLQEDSLLQEFVRAASLRHKTGEGNLLEKMTAENKQQQLQQNILEVEMARMVAMLKIQQIMGAKGDFTPADSSLGLLRFVQITDSSRLADNPMLRYAQAQLRVIEAEQKTAKKEGLPDFRVGYFVQSFAGPMEVNGQIRNFSAIPRFQGVTLGISVPIFGGAAYKAKSEGLGLRAEAMKKEQEALQNQLESRLEQLLQYYVFYQSNLNYYQKTALPNANLIVKNAKQTYQNGEAGYVEYLQALQTGLETQKSYWATIYKFNQTVIEIQYLVGEDN